MITARCMHAAPAAVASHNKTAQVAALKLALCTCVELPLERETDALHPHLCHRGLLAVEGHHIRARPNGVRQRPLQRHPLRHSSRRRGSVGLASAAHHMRPQALPCMQPAAHARVPCRATHVACNAQDAGCVAADCAVGEHVAHVGRLPIQLAAQPACAGAMQGASGSVLHPATPMVALWEGNPASHSRYGVETPLYIGPPGVKHLARP